MDPENEGKNSLKSDKMKWESLKENNDSYKDTSKLISSEYIKDKCHNASSPLNHSRPNDSIAHLRLNVKVLYGLIVGLSAIFICSGIICTLHIRALRRELDMVSDVIYHMHNGAMGIQEKSPIAELLKQTRFLDQNSSASDKARFWAAVSGEQDKRNQDAKGETHPNRGTREKRNANDGAPEEWAWMSSYARVPVNAMDAYCQEVKTYCNARGPRGLPGAKGDKGDKGEDGTRTHNGRVMRGPAGPKGDRGSPGPEGPQGKMGPTGPRGQDGNQGPAGEKGDKGSAGRTGTPGAMAQKGERGHIGPQGPKGDKGKDGMHGVPGLRGHKGDMGRQGHRGMRGPTGNKGEPGVCETFQCVDMEQPTEATTTTTALTLPPLKKECSVKVIGTPLLLGRRRPPQGTQGSFMLDAAGTRGRRDLGKVWATFGTEGNTISEYADITSFKDDKNAKEINLSGSPFFGTGHKVHDEIFYYHWKGEPKIVRFDLNRGEATTVRVLPDFIDISSTEEREQAFLYSSKASIVDFHLDRNGLWAIYIQNSTRKVVAAFLDKTTLDVKATVPLDGLEPRSRGGAFVVCGKLYTIRHHNRLHSHLDSVFDLWQNGKFDTIEIKIKIPYRQNAMLSYNYRVVQILGWDSNKQMDYPLILV